VKTPLLGASYVARSVNAADNRMVNLFPEVIPEGGKERGWLQRAPGLRRLLSVGTGPIRGLWSYGGLAYAVSGSKLYRVTAAGVATVLGDVTGTGPVSMSDNGTQLFIAANPDGFIYNASNGVFDQITDPDFPGAAQVGYLDGYFVFIEPNSQRVWVTELLDGTSVDPLDFASAEGNPDGLVGLIVDHREVWLFGEQSVEVWVNSGNADFPLERLNGAFNEVGCAATFSVAKLDNGVFWLGADDRGRGVVYRANGYTAVRISTHAVEWHIQSYGDISDAIAYSYQQDGHTFYVLTFPSADRTWVYDVATNAWHERASFDNGVLRRHRSNCQTAFNNEVWVGDFEDGRIYALDLETYEDDDQAQKWLRSWRALPAGTNTLNRTAQHQLQLDCEAGVGLNGIDTTVVLIDIELLTEDSDEILTESPTDDVLEYGTLPQNAEYLEFLYSGTRFVAIQRFSTANIYWSDNGINWNFAFTLPTGFTYLAAGYGGGEFIIVRNDATAYVSSDGITWTTRVVPNILNRIRMKYSGTQWLMLASGNTAFVSPDGVAWSSVTLPVTSNWHDAVWTGTEWLAVVRSVNGWGGRSTDGVTWFFWALPAGWEWGNIGYHNGTIIITQFNGGVSVRSTDNGATWNLNVIGGAAIQGIVYVDNRWFVAGDSSTNAYATSLDDGVTWTYYSQPINVGLQDPIPLGDRVFVGSRVGENSLIINFADPEVSVPILLDQKQTQGVVPKVMLRWSDDGGHTWSNEHWREMGRIGEFGTRVIWRRLGMTGKLRDRVYEVSGTDPVKIALMGAELDVSPSRD